LEIYNKQEYNNKIEFNKIREDYNCIKLKDKLTKNEKIKFASYFIYLNKRSFNGLYRENKSGLYNVPYRKYNSDIFHKEKIIELSNFLNNHDVKIKNNNIFDIGLFDIIKKYKIDNSNILVYLDPPYYPSKKSKFTSYNKEIFNINEQEKLKDLCDKLNQDNIKFIMSNSPCDEVKKLYQNYQQKELYIGRQMRSGQGISQVYSEKNKSNEILIWNF
jgi:DNA adenine methylase